MLHPNFSERLFHALGCIRARRGYNAAAAGNKSSVALGKADLATMEVIYPDGHGR
jgi:hypothetical protein